jgi:hypothetical protein
MLTLSYEKNKKDKAQVNDEPEKTMSPRALLRRRGLNKPLI